MPYFPNMSQKSSTKMSTSNTSLDNTSDQDYSEFLNEYLLHTNSPTNEPETQYEDGEMEAEWLIAAGFPQLTKPFEQGLELHTADLEPILASLSKPHAEAIKQRVRALNHTVRGRTKNRQRRKPDIRDVFSITRDFDESSTGTRSRSATPDSLDSIHGDEVWDNTIIPSFVSIFDNGHNTDMSVNNHHHQHHSLQHHASNDVHLLHQRNKLIIENGKQKLRRTPSEPLKGYPDIFRGSHVRCDIPMYSADGIELLGFSRIGTIHIPRTRSGSDPSCSVGRTRGEIMQQDSHSDHNTSSGDSSDECLSHTLRSTHHHTHSTPEKILNKLQLDTPPQSVQNSPSSRDGISFESMIRETSSQEGGLDLVDSSDMSLEVCTDIDTINETELKRLQPIFWLELAAIFDRNHVSLDKRKPYKRRRKEEGNLFGVSLNALIRRDQQITGKDSSLVPLFLEGVLDELARRGAREEGILRVGGHKQKTELLYNELESSFYQKPKKFAQLLSSASVHDLSALLKRWLRELPQPLLSNELIQLFYQCHALPPNDQAKALAIVCQMLPHENRATLRKLLCFLNYVIEQRDLNKMNLHNVATIIAPSFFPPRHIHPTNKNSIEEQVKMAAQCCRLTNTLIMRGEMLFQVPNHLIEVSRTNKGKKGGILHRRVKATTSLLQLGSSSNNNNHKSNNNNNNRSVSNTIIIHTKNNNNNNNNNNNKNDSNIYMNKNGNIHHDHHIEHNNNNNSTNHNNFNVNIINNNNNSNNTNNNNNNNNIIKTNTLIRQQSINPSHVHRLII